MTVCIAARCAEGAVFAAADRLVTVGDMEMEHPIAKVMLITQSLMILPSDEDAAFHEQILLEVYTVAKRRVEADPLRWLTVQEILDLYAETRQGHKTRRAERDILKPLGLDHTSYLARQKDMEPGLVNQIAQDLINYKIPYLSAIITGLDSTGSHIFVADTNNENNLETGQYDSIGYAAIGAGGRHANAQFLMAEHAWHTPLPEALWNIYLAKKRSEVAPGVGETTDLYMIGPALGAGMFLDPAVHRQLEAIYNSTKEQEAATRHKAGSEIMMHAKELVVAAEAAKSQVVPPPEPGPIYSPADVADPKPRQ